MAVVITITNQKGGIGKTTTASTLISGLSERGYQVLGIDLDPQGNLGFSLGVGIEEAATIYDVFKNNVPLTRAICRTQYGDIIPSNILLSGADLEFNRPNGNFCSNMLWRISRISTIISSSIRRPRSIS